MNNFIKYAKIDGAPAYSDCKNGLMSFYHEQIFSSEIIEFSTEQILVVGDTIQTEDGELSVRERIYYPKDNHFVFLCDSVYTGRRK
jgi:hypothetical protein